MKRLVLLKRKALAFWDKIDNFFFIQRSKIWKLQGRLDTILVRQRFKKKKHTNIPFYDKRDDIYRVFFEDRFDEFGDLGYVVGEYIRDGLIYHYRLKGNLMGDEFVDHEHSFAAILEVITDCHGRGFSIKGYEDEYSSQELNIIRKYIAKLKEDLKSRA